MTCQSRAHKEISTGENLTFAAVLTVTPTPNLWLGVEKHGGTTVKMGALRADEALRKYDI